MSAELKPLAWMRKWAFDGETPVKTKNANNRMHWGKFRFLPVSVGKCSPDDVPLIAAPPAQGELTDALPEINIAIASISAGDSQSFIDGAKWAQSQIRAQQDTASDTADAAMWRALVKDADAMPCKYPCLRDDLGDWMSDYAAIQAQAGDAQGGGNG